MKLLVAVLFSIVVVSAAPSTFKSERFAETPAEHFQCAADYLGELSKKNGLGDLWARTEPELRRHIADWIYHQQIGSQLYRVVYHLRFGLPTFKCFAEYLQEVAKQNPKLSKEFAHGVPQRCHNQNTAESFGKLFDP